MNLRINLDKIHETSNVQVTKIFTVLPRNPRNVLFPLFLWQAAGNPTPAICCCEGVGQCSQEARVSFSLMTHSPLSFSGSDTCEVCIPSGALHA